VNTFVDCIGRDLAPGDTVEIKEIPMELVKGLPDEDQEAIRAKLGATVVIVGFDVHGNAELEFVEAQDQFRTIWVETRCLMRR
jgi:hypothetical protein